MVIPNTAVRYFDNLVLLKLSYCSNSVSIMQGVKFYFRLFQSLTDAYTYLGQIIAGEPSLNLCWLSRAYYLKQIQPVEL